jgi:hypothetical protein
MEVKDIYPLTIISDRYNGSYSGGAYLAFNLDPWDLPDEVGGGDVEEHNYWDIKSNHDLVGKGFDVVEAVNDLLKKIILFRSCNE